MKNYPHQQLIDKYLAKAGVTWRVYEAASA